MIEELIQGFDSGMLCELLNAKFSGAFSAASKSIPIEDDLPWERAEQLGVVKTLPGSNELNMPLLVIAVELPEGEELRERSSRIRQFRFAKKVLDDAMSNPSPGVEGIISQGLFVFHDDSGNFRLSLVYGKPEGTKLVWSAVRRLSFYVEAGAGNKTFRDRAALSWSSFEKLKEAFSVEKLAKEFYSRLFKWYQWALSDEMGVTYPNNTETDDDDRDIGEHIIRLITRLMFVWFLKQKHLVPSTIFDPDELKHILKKFNPASGDNYYRTILQNLFFATLNSEISERAFAVDAGNIKENKEHFDIKTLYRYGKDFAISNEEVLQLFKSIPFLNGGLFECLDRGKNYYDGFSRNRNKRAKVPNSLFFDETDGLIPLLNQYNFTVEENSPGDEEVALDPELLGKVFENLLGAYNPETEVAARKATGSFYTPREIVNYMVDESLIAHLKGQCSDDSEKAIRNLFADGERPSDKLCEKLDQVLVTAKILDPACGSGAFPMGVLLKMVEILRILRGIPEDESVYGLKLQLIENCIYGADIQCIAVQISKLRFFISLVCEQTPTKNAKKNYGINSLPNLETKFVAANTLIGLPRDGEMLPMQNVEKLKKDLWHIRHRHFLARTYQDKKELRKEDKKLRTELAEELKHGGGFDTESAKLMAEWDPYDQNTRSPFLDAEWMFNVRDGFDVVIGNPPYVRVQLLGHALTDRYKSIWSTAYKRLDISALFFEAATQFLAQSGIGVYISSKQFLDTEYGRKMREYFLSDAGFDSIVDFQGLPVFQGQTTYVAIFFFRRITTKHFSYAQVDALPFVSTDLKFGAISTSPLDGNTWGLCDPVEMALTLTLKALPRLETVARCWAGVFTGKDDILLFDEDDPRLSQLEPDLLIPVMRAQGCQRYLPAVPSKVAIYPYEEVDGKARLIPEPDLKKRFPQGYAYLRKHKKVLAARRDSRTTLGEKGQWYGLVRFGRPSIFGQRKLVSPGEVKHNSFALDDTGAAFSCARVFAVTVEPDSVTLDFLLGLLNSSLAEFFLHKTAPLKSGGYYTYSSAVIGSIPFALDLDDESDKAQHDAIAELAKQVAVTRAADPTADVSSLESEIDQLVYKLYGLTPEEIAIVEESAAGSAMATGRSKTPKAKKEPARKRKTKLPPSLPGWD